MNYELAAIMDIPSRLTSGVVDVWPEIESHINELASSHSIDEAQGSICDSIIEAWLFRARQQLEAEYASLVADLDARAKAAELHLRHALEDFDGATQALRVAQSRLAAYEVEVERGIALP